MKPNEKTPVGHPGRTRPPRYHTRSWLPGRASIGAPETAAVCLPREVPPRSNANRAIQRQTINASRKQKTPRTVTGRGVEQHLGTLRKAKLVPAAGLEPATF